MQNERKRKKIEFFSRKQFGIPYICWKDGLYFEIFHIMNKTTFFKFTFVFFFCISNNMMAQTNSRTYINNDKLVVPFEPEKTQLNEIIDALNCTLSSTQQPFNKLDKYFFDAELTQQYIAMLEKGQYPKINQSAAPMLMAWSNGVKQLLQSYQGKLAEIKLVDTRQRYGTTPDMKIVSASMHLTFKDGSLEPIRLMLIDFNGYYRILNLEE